MAIAMSIFRLCHWWQALSILRSPRGIFFRNSVSVNLF